MIEARTQNLDPEPQSAAWLQRAEFRDFITERGGNYSDQEPIFEAGYLNLVLFQPATDRQTDEFQVAQIIEKTVDESGVTKVLVDTDLTGKPAILELNDPTISAFGSVKLAPQSERTTKDSLSVGSSQEISTRTGSPDLKRSRDEVINQLRLKLIASAALAGTAITIMNTSPPQAAAGFSRDGTKSHISAPLVHSPPKKKPKSNQENSGGAQAHVQNSETKVVVLIPKGSLWEIAKSTGLPVEPELHAIENINKVEIARAGGVHDLPPGLKVVVPIKSEPEAAQVHQTQPSSPKPETRRFVLEHGGSIYEIAEDVERDHETNLSLGREVNAIIDANKKPIDEAGGVHRLPDGMVIEAPIDRNPPKPPAVHVQSQEQKLKTQQELEIQEFKNYFKERHGESWAGSPNAAVKVGDSILYQDSKTHELKIGKIEYVLGEGADRILVADNGVSAISYVIEIGDIPPAKVSPPPVAKVPNESVVTQIPLIIPTASDTSIIEINSDPTGAPPPQIAGLHSSNADSLLNNETVQESVPPPPSPAPSPLPPKAPSTSNVFNKKMIDFSVPPKNLPEVAAAGDVAVIEYVGRPGEGEKLLTPAKIVKDHNAGLAVGIVFEAGARDALGGYAEGVKDGTQALKDELALGVPKYVVTYFAADFDPSQKDLEIINEYLKGEESIFVDKGGYTDGEYGGYAAVTSALDSGRVKWVIQAYAWSGGKWNPGAQIRQYANHRIVVGATVDLDKGTAGAYARMWLPTKTPGGIIASATPTSASPKAPTPSAIPAPSNASGSSEMHNFIDSTSSVGNNQPGSPTTPNIDRTLPKRDNLFNAIVTASSGNNRQILSMLMGSWLESGWHTGSVGAGSYGPFQIQNPGESGGPHPDITVLQSKDPNSAAEYMTADYSKALSTVDPNLWISNPELAAELTADRAERPKLSYYSSQGSKRVNQAYNAAIRKMKTLGISTDFSQPPTPPQ